MVFFLCQIIKEKQLQYKQLVSGFFWAKWCPFPFSHVSTHRCASSCFFQIWMFLFWTSIYRRFGNGEVDSFWRDRVKTSDVKSTINRCFTNCSSCIMKCFPTPCCNLYPFVECWLNVRGAKWCDWPWLIASKTTAPRHLYRPSTLSSDQNSVICWKIRGIMG